MRDRAHYFEMLTRNQGATIGYTLAAKMVVSVFGAEIPSDHWKVRDTARWLRARYGEVMTVDEVRREMGAYDQAEAADAKQLHSGTD